MSSAVSVDVKEILKQVVKKDIDNFDVMIHDPNKKGAGFLGELVYITLRDKETGKDFNLVVKQLLNLEPGKGKDFMCTIFTNEIHFYDHVWRKLDEFQAQIPSQYHFQKLPKCFAVIVKEDSQKLVMENLKLQGFDVYDKKKPVDKNHFELILKQYGKFHGLSFAFKALYPEEYANLVNDLTNVFLNFTDSKMFLSGLKANNEVCMESLQEGTDGAVRDKFRSYLHNYKEMFNNSIDCTTKYTAIIHGDCWSNNMMFKYDESGKAVDVRLIDFQMVKEGSPCCDLSYCIYSGATKEILEDLDRYLRFYHGSLSETLRAFGCDPEEIFPFEELKKDWKQYCQLGFMMALRVWKIKLTKEGEVKDLTDQEKEEVIMHRTGYDQEAYKRVCRDLVLHLYDNDFL